MPPPMQSVIWSYFDLDEYDRNKSQCKICNKTYSRKGRTTTSLKNHLKSMHPEQYTLKSKRQVTSDQLNGLIEFLNKHQELAKGLSSGGRGKFSSIKLWNQCAGNLNAYEDGSIKDGKGWSKYWCDWKYRVRRRGLQQKLAIENNEALPEGFIALSPLEETILTIIGDHTVDTVVIKSDPLAEEETWDEHVEDKTETMDTASNFFDSRLDRSNKRKYCPGESINSNECSESSSPRERKPRLSSYQNENQSDNDSTIEFLRLEKEKLENSRKMLKSVHTIANEVTRLADIMSNISDFLRNYTNNI